MKFLKSLLSLLALSALSTGAALADGQVGPQQIGVLPAYGLVCNQQAVVSYGYQPGCAFDNSTIVVSSTGVVSTAAAALPTQTSKGGDVLGTNGTTAAWVNSALDTTATFTIGSGTGACATQSTLTGGSHTGSFLCTGTAGASTAVLVLPTAPHGWSCWVSDLTSGVAGATVAPLSTTGATLKITIATTSDVVQFGCNGY